MLATLLAIVVASPTELVFVRHAETQANASGHYMAANLNAFSPKGEKQVAALTTRLLGEGAFTKIYVSPSPRAMRTILPYLKATHRKATIWPLLYECCTGKRPASAHATKFAWGPKIKLDEMAPYFILVPGQDRYPVASDFNAGLAQVEAAMKAFPGLKTGGRILMVGHSGQGGQMLHRLTGRWQKIGNTQEFDVPLR